MFAKLTTLAVIFFGTLAVAKGDTLLLPGGSLPPDLLYPNGTLLALVTGTISAGPFDVVYTAIAYADNSSVVCPGCIDFAYRFTNNGSNTIGGFTMADFAGFTTDVGYNAGSDPFVSPGSITRTQMGPLSTSFSHPVCRVEITSPATGHRDKRDGLHSRHFQVNFRR